MKAIPEIGASKINQDDNKQQQEQTNKNKNYLEKEQSELEKWLFRGGIAILLVGQFILFRKITFKRQKLAQKPFEQMGLIKNSQKTELIKDREIQKQDFINQKQQANK